MAMDTKNFSGISSESVQKATGLAWDEWLEALDVAGAEAWDHKQIVAFLDEEYAETTTAWWRQSITVGYEQARGKRVVGETATAGFQLGVQVSVDAARSRVWDLITSKPELWLGEGASLTLEKGERYEVPARPDVPGVAGEIRVVRPEDRLRLTWQPEGWAAPATLQLITSESPSGRTALRAHLEKLPDAETREAMRTHWRAVLDKVASAAG